MSVSKRMVRDKYSMASLYELSACEAVEKIAKREVSPFEFVQSLLYRIESLEPNLKAWAVVDAKGALTAARQSESVLASGQQPRLLEGLPLGIKDVYYTAGLRTSAASPILANFVPEEDAGAVDRLRRAGAIILGKTVTTQFASGVPSPTHNPWNYERTPGGSSSGSGAAVSARMVPAALGTQSGGSILRPAAYCGVVGLKPTFGRISRRNVLQCAWSLDTMGVISRNVCDAALLFQALAGYDLRDAGSFDVPVEDYVTASRTPKMPRLGLIREFLDRCTLDGRLQTEKAALQLEQAGASVQEVSFPGDFDLAHACCKIILNAEKAEIHSLWHAKHPQSYAAGLRANIEVGQLIPAVSYLRAQRWRRWFRNAVEGLFTNFDALLCPSAPDVAPNISTTGKSIFLAPWTMLGLPAISLPSGLNAEGLPFGIQLVTRAWDEANLLSAARWCEDVFGMLPPPC